MRFLCDIKVYDKCLILNSAPLPPLFFNEISKKIIMIVYDCCDF